MFAHLLQSSTPPPARVLACGDRLSETLRGIECEIPWQSPASAVVDTLNAAKYEVYRCICDHLGAPLPAKALTLKVLNLLLAKHHFLRRSMSVSSQPFGLVVDPSNGCGLACPGCVHSPRAEKLGLFHWNKDMLSGARATSFLERYGPCAVQAVYCNYGEPLLNPDTPRFIRLAKSYLLAVTLSSSLSLPRFDAEAYVASGLDYFVVSIDGATQPVYEHYRRRGKLDLVLSNVKKLVEARERMGKRTPVVSWHYLAFEHNLHEIPQASAIARDLGVDRFVLVPPFSVAWDEPDIRPVLRRQIIFEFGSDSKESIARNWNPFPDSLAAFAIERAFEAPWPADVSAGEEQPATEFGHTCHWLYRDIVMDAGGRVFPCCAAPRPDAPLTFANLRETTKDDLFNTTSYRLARLSFSNPEAYRSAYAQSGLNAEPYCAQCDWNQKATNVNATEVRHYLEAAGGDLFHGESLRLLADW